MLKYLVKSAGSKCGCFDKSEYFFRVYYVPDLIKAITSFPI